MILPKQEIGKTNMIDDLIMEISSDSDNDVIIEIDETDKPVMYSTIDRSDDPKSEAKYIKYIEKLVRKSDEYRRYIGILKTDFDLTSCMIFDKIDIKDTKVTMEFHHYPATLFDIVQAVRNKIVNEHGINSNEAYSSFKIADEVMKLHYEGKVGLVPLTKTAHELIHNGDIFIPLNQNYVFGDYTKMIDAYPFSGDFKRKYDTLLELSDEENGIHSITTDKFEFKGVQVNMLEAEKPNKVIMEEENVVDDLDISKVS